MKTVEDIKIGIVCGCFPTQPGIVPDELYHRVLAKRIENEKQIIMNVASTWYNTVASGFALAQQLISTEKPDIILFHVRPDPFLRISKIWMKYNDKEKRVKKKINLDADDAMIADDFTPAASQRLRQKKSLLHQAFRQLNYLLGILTGSHSNAIEKERMSIENILVECEQKKLPVIIVGPASRDTGFLENILLHRLEKKLSLYFKDKSYVTCFGTRDKNGERLFMEDGIHVSPIGHKRIADLIYPFLSKIVMANSLEES